MVHDFISRSYQPDAFFNISFLKILKFISILSSDENSILDDELCDFVFTLFTLQHRLIFKHAFTQSKF